MTSTDLDPAVDVVGGWLPVHHCSSNPASQVGRSIEPMANWAGFREAEAGMSEEGRRLLYRNGEGAGLLSTVREGALPRIHPVNVGIVGDGLYAFILDSAKRRDLEQDGRFALHSHQDPAAPSEFMVRGRAQAVDPGTVRDAVAKAWYFTVDDTYRLFEFSIESALYGARPSVDSWPPEYVTWKAPV